METSQHSTNLLPTVNCSSCGSEVELVRLGDHLCSQRSSDASLIDERTDAGFGNPSYSPPPDELQHQPPRRPQLSRIDPSYAGKPFHSYAGELTPASSVQGSISSSASFTSTRKSPRRAPRKPYTLDTRRPPSPELTNLDCAFPPFPSQATRSAPPSANGRNSRLKHEKQHTNGSRPDTSSSARSSKHSTGQRHPSSTISTGTQRHYSRSTSNGDDTVSRLSTTAESRHPSYSSSTESRKPSLDENSRQTVLHSSLSESPVSMEPIHREMSNSASNEVPKSQLSDILKSRSPVFSRTRVPSKTHGEVEDPTKWSAVDGSDGVNIAKNTDAAMSKEPSYKSKRPPPLDSNSKSWNSYIDSTTTISPPTIMPAPASAGLLSRGFTKFFGSKRSASTASRREIVRHALSDEPLETEVASQRFDSAFEQPRMPPQTPKTILTPKTPASLAEALHDDQRRHAPPTDSVDGNVSTPTIVIESEPVAHDQFSEEAVEHFNQTSTLSIIMEASGERDSKRLSTESASSYGSIGFTERSISSRSSIPSTDDLTRHLSDNNYHELVQDLIDEKSPPRQRPLAIVPEGPLKPSPNKYDELTIKSPEKPALMKMESYESSFDATENAAGLSTQSLTVDTTGNIPATRSKGTCRGCSEIILTTQKSVSSADGRLTGRYHKQCFVCQTCRIPFATAEFYVHQDSPYCAHHYHELENSLCATCGNGIEGLYMETANVTGKGKEKHHPHCLKCTTCQAQLDNDYFELSGKVYCERDAFRIASLPRGYDTAPARPSPLVREYISSGDPGLLKGKNFPERRITRLMNMV